MNRKLHFAGHFLLGIAAIAGFGAVVLFLWNALVPTIFGLSAINFWQALGLLALCRLLFGGNGGKWLPDGFHKRPLREKWMRMSFEERREFIRNHRFGHDSRQREYDFSDIDKSEKKD